MVIVAATEEDAILAADMEKADKKRAVHVLMGRNLTRLREAKGMTQTDLAAAIDTEQKYISHMETGRRGVSKAKMQLLCELFQVSESEFLRPVENVTPAEKIDGMTMAMLELWESADPVKRALMLVEMQKLMEQKREKPD